MNAHTTTKRFRRAALAAVATLSGAALLIGGTATAGAQEPETDDAPHISVAFTPAAEQGNCVPAGLGLSYVVFSDDSVFRLTVNAASPQCSPIDASAVIYGMPGNGEAWPQQLLEREPVRISEAGVYEITFDKECEPVQFDVVTGVTPQTITPGGVFHGPLLFPFDVNTSEQYWGNGQDCPPPSTTTTTTESTTTTTESTTTTSTPEVLGSTTVPAEVDSVTTVPTTNDVEVGGVSVTRQPAALALTGSNAGLGALGVALLVAGMALIALQRRRSA